MERVLAWYADKDQKQLLWEVFHKTFDLNPVLFFDTFGSFVANCLLDDSAFKVEYHVPFHDHNHELVWEKEGFKTIVVDKADPKSTPVVTWDNDGSQDVALLMEAMDKAEARAQRRMEEYLALEEFYAKME